PLQASQAFTIMSERIRAKALGIDKLDARQGRIAVSFKDRQTVPPRAFVLMGRVNREAYVTKEQFIWPYSGAPIPAIERLLESFA
ncbi:hypothetical protein ABTA82_19800, partial [Acinetobacter baumannii]